MSFEESLKSYSKFQNTLHIGDNNQNKDHYSNKIYSHFYNNFQKDTPYKHFTENLEKVEDILKSSVKYSINVKHDGLLSTKLIQQLPTIIMKKPPIDSVYARYEGKWTHNIGLNIFKEGTWKFNEEQPQWIDSISIDQYYQAMAYPEQKSKYNKSIGNVFTNQNWSVITPEYICSLVIPWGYSVSYGNFLPLYLCGHLDRITHDIILRRFIKDLYMIRGVKKDGSYEYLKFTSEIVASVGDLSNFDADITLSFPEMKGKYVNISEAEKKVHRCAETSQSSRNVLYVNNIIALDSEDVATCGKTLSVTTDKSLPPIHTYMWVAQNESSQKISFYSNYSTNKDFISYSPIEKTTISGVIEDCPAYETERDHVYMHFPSEPKEPGYNYWTLGLKARDNYPLPSEKNNNLKITVTLKDNNPSSNIPTSHELYQKPTESKFRLKVRLIHLKRITLTSFATSEEKRKDLKSSILIEE